MKKKLNLSAFIILLIANCGFAQQTLRKIAADLYLSTAKKSDYIYLADTTLEKFPFKYNDIKDEVKAEDRQILCEILMKGKPHTISGSEIGAMLGCPERAIGFKEFESIAPAMIDFSPDEENIIRVFDSIQNLKRGEKYRSPELVRLENNILKSNIWRVYWEKAYKIDKRLLLFYPAFSYKNYWLVIVNGFQSMTNTYLFIKIAKVN
jgi:hypothetical protein